MRSSNLGGGGITWWAWPQGILIVLKSLDIIDWSWWWVLSPMLVGLGIVLALMLAAFISVLADEI